MKVGGAAGKEIKENKARLNLKWKVDRKEMSSRREKTSDDQQK